MDNGEGFKNSLVLTISYERSLVYSFNDILNAETLDNYYNEEQIKEFTGSGDSEGSQSAGISTLPVEEEKYKSIGPITLSADIVKNVQPKNSQISTYKIGKDINLEEVSAVKEFSAEVYAANEDGKEIDFSNETTRNEAIENTLKPAYNAMFNSMLESYGWSVFDNAENDSICLGEIIYYVKQQKTPVEDKNNPNNNNIKVSAISVKCVGKTYNLAGCSNKLETCKDFTITKINGKVVPEKPKESQESQESQETQETQETKETYESVLANAPLDLINTVFADAEVELRKQGTQLVKQIVKAPVYKYPNGKPELVS
jgi:hypothetical protein